MLLRPSEMQPSTWAKLWLRGKTPENKDWQLYIAVGGDQRNAGLYWMRWETSRDFIFRIFAAVPTGFRGRFGQDERDLLGSPSPSV